jgi:hypothetical protein
MKLRRRHLSLTFRIQSPSRADELNVTRVILRLAAVVIPSLRDKYSEKLAKNSPDATHGRGRDVTMTVILSAGKDGSARCGAGDVAPAYRANK